MNSLWQYFTIAGAAKTDAKKENLHGFVFTGIITLHPYKHLLS